MVKINFKPRTNNHYADQLEPTKDTPLRHWVYPVFMKNTDLTPAFPVWWLLAISWNIAGSRSASRCLIHRRTNESFEMARHHTTRICKTDADGAEGLRVWFNVRPDLSAWILKDGRDGFKETKKKNVSFIAQGFSNLSVLERHYCARG